MKRIVLTISYIFILLSSSFSQVIDYSKNKSLVFTGTLVDDDILFRWAPENENLLKYGQKHGFELTQIYSTTERQFIMRDTIYLRPETDWNNYEQENYTFQAAKQLNFGLSTQELDSYSLLERFSITNNLFYFKLFYADLSPIVASYMGLGFTRHNLNFSGEYVGQLRMLDVDTLTETLQIVLDSTSILKLDPIAKITDNSTDEAAVLQWQYELYDEQYIAYNIERSLDGTTFTQLNNRPFLPMTSATSPKAAEIIEYSDSTLLDGQTALYRIQGISFFGIDGPYSEPLKITRNPNLLSQGPVLNNAFENDLGAFELSWNFEKDWEKDVDYFTIERSIDGRETFQAISGQLSADQRTWSDQNPGIINYYKITVRDRNGHTTTSFPILGQLSDNEPPLMPTGLQGFIDSSGQVSLSWAKNIELDLLGYYVFYSNTKNGEYSILTNSSIWKDTSFIDSIYTNTLADKIYYKVMALDFRGNQSPFSEALTLKRPDFYPPTPALFKRRESRVGSIYFEYTNSSSQDLVSNVLERSVNQQDWFTIAENTERNTTLAYNDTLVDCQKDYFYRIISTDDDDLATTSKILQMTCIDNGQRASIEAINVNQVEEKKQVHISCSYPITVPIRSIMIYRSEDTGKFQKIKQFWKKDIAQVSDFEYYDQTVNTDKTYAYKVVFRFDDNGFATSPISEKINIK